MDDNLSSEASSTSTTDTEESTTESETTSEGAGKTTAETETMTGGSDSTTAETETTTGGSDNTTADTETTTGGADSTTAKTEATTGSSDNTTVDTETSTVGSDNTTVDTETSTGGADSTTAETETTTEGAASTTQPQTTIEALISTTAETETITEAAAVTTKVVGHTTIEASATTTAQDAATTTKGEASDTTTAKDEVSTTKEASATTTIQTAATTIEAVDSTISQATVTTTKEAADTTTSQNALTTTMEDADTTTAKAAATTTVEAADTTISQATVTTTIEDTDTTTYKAAATTTVEAGDTTGVQAAATTTIEDSAKTTTQPAATPTKETADTTTSQAAATTTIEAADSTTVQAAAITTIEDSATTTTHPAATPTIKASDTTTSQAAVTSTAAAIVAEGTTSGDMTTSKAATSATTDDTETTSTKQAEVTTETLTITTLPSTTTEDVCANISCQNGGVCVRRNDEGLCQCNGNYTGSTCQYAVPSYTSWSVWGACDQTCGDGLQTRTRNCTDVTGADRDWDCGNELKEEKACNGLQACVVSSNPCDAAINPCASDGVTHTCRVQRDGSFKCSCENGFINDANGVYCVNEDECMRSNNDCKDIYAKTFKVGVSGCRDTVGSYDCTCSSGFTYNSTTRACSDFDECDSSSLNNCDIAPRATCTNTPGSFTCACKSGYTGEGTTGTCKENRLLSFTGHTNLSSAAYSAYFFPQYAIPVGNFLYPSFYFTRGGLLLFSTVTSVKESTGTRRLFTNPSTFSLDSSFQEKAAFAPWWSNMVVGSDSESGVYYKEYSSDDTTENNFMLAQRNDFNASFVGFSMSPPKYMIVITWNKMERSKTPPSPSQTVTFQLVMLSDYENTYIKVIYNDREMTWDVLNSVSNYPVRIGLLKQNETVEEYPQSYLDLLSKSDDKDKIQKIDEVIPTGLVGAVEWDKKGFAYYRISKSGGSTSHPGLQCSAYIETQRTRQQTSQYSVVTADVSKCPPTLLQMTDYFANFTSAGIPTTMTCYAKQKALSSTASDQQSQRCCYDNSNKGLITDSTIAKGYNTYMIGQPTSEVQIAADQNFGTCCNAENSYASKIDLCDKFLEVLPVCSSDNFVASGAGDPHLTTLDGLSFTFNGHGEFILLQASDVEVQGRFSPQRNPAGVKSATYISAVAGQQSSPISDKVEFRLNSGKNNTEILKNGVLQSVDLSSGAVDWNEVSITKSVSSQNIPTWKMIFSGGLTAGIQLNNQMFQLVIEAASNYRSNFKGLLGNFDGQTSNDFTSPNGTITPSSSVESDIYTYGVEWQNNASDTLFTYNGGDNNTAWSSHIDSSYTPVFFNADLTVMFTNASKRATAISTCNNGESTDSDPEKRRECYFDFKVTENAALASSTSDTKTALVETQSTLANYPPEIKNGNVTIEVSVGGNFTLQLIAEDQNGGDTISLFLNSDTPSGLSVDNTTKILTWSEVQDSNSMSIQITASDGKAQSLWTPKIKLCKCQNGATCGFNVDSSDQFYIVPCTCVTGYDGDFCQNDMDGCAASPCFPGVTCSDVLARDLATTPDGFQCGSCPTHLVGNGTNCSDKDECVENQPPLCSQNCTNIANGYTCSCVSGYILGSDHSTCQDIDECLIKTDKCDAATTVCNNTVGSYTCDCKTGFSTDTTYACTDINECSSNPCPVNSRCENTVSSYTCTCNFGYEKNTQTNTCEDRDECAGSNNCQQKCVDGVGTYTCSCNTGYRLNETDLVSCLPENECTAIKKSTCDGGSGRASCAVSNGDVLCSCPSGYALNGTNYCIDIDECSTGADNCVKTKSDCINLQRGFNCQCKSGYKALSAFVCADIDECASSSNNSCISPATCTNNEGGYLCVCPSGYVSSGQYSCNDINECASAATHACDKNYGECSNTPGRYTCTCNKGFTGNGYVCADLNECASSTTNNCTQICFNSIGSYTCSCLNGYQLDADKITCNDVNECNDTSANGCYSNSYCTNTVGSYTCSCPIDYRLKGDGKTCQSIYQCAANHGCSHTCGRKNNIDTCSCPTGMELDNTNKTCVDTNECASLSTNLCRLVNNVVCLDTNGSYVCNCVNSSYVKTQATVCVDADECVLGTANCPANSRCVNQNPGYECQCLTGYSKLGAICQDINECNQANDCNKTLGVCANTAGGYTCACKSGYAGDGRTCIDVDECSLNTHNCDSRVARRICTNTPGSFTCGCISGYQLAGDQRTCNDVDECTGNHGCSQICQNKDGGYDCACQTGYRLEADQRTCVVEIECGAAKKATCQNRMCAKVNGTDTCQCPSGYQLAGDGTICNDIDECLRKPCYATNSNCTNTEGGYNCSCTNGYILGPNNVCKDRNGGLSNWTPWGSCSKTCGSGTQTRNRACNNPTRKRFGADCVGPLTESQDCNTQLCPPTSTQTPTTTSHAATTTQTPTATTKSPITTTEVADTTNAVTETTQAQTSTTQAPTTTIYTAATSTQPSTANPATTSTQPSSTTSTQSSTTTTQAATTTTQAPTTTTQDVCANISCQNGGVCVRGSGCQCNGNYTGNTCQYAIPSYTSWSVWGACDSDCGDGLQTRTRNCTDFTGAERGGDCGNELKQEKACVGLPACIVTTNPCDAIPDPCEADGVTHTCRVQSGGTFKCSCLTGFVNEGVYCVNDNECNHDNNDCKDINTKTFKVGVSGCRDTVGSYDCTCSSGFTYNSTTRICSDVNECDSSSLNNCDIASRATCTNTPGSFTCACKSGYTGEGNTGTCKENRLLSFTGHTNLSSDAYSGYFFPQYAIPVGNFLYPSFYFTRGGLLLFSTVTSDTESTGTRRLFTNPSTFSLDSSFQEKAAFAPWWSNMAVGSDDSASGVYYKEYSSNATAENNLMLAQKNDFNANFAGFSMSAPKYMIVITWYKMELSKTPASPSQTVTFQLVMLSDYENTYIKVIYNDREMTWDVLNSVGNYPVRIGLLKQNETVEEYPQSYLDLLSKSDDKDKIQKIDEVIPTGLVGAVEWSRKGFAYYRISKSGGFTSHPGLQCSAYIETQRTRQQTPQYSVVIADVSKCPPTLLQMTDYFVKFTSAGIPSTMTCYAKRKALSSTASDQRSQRCCYDNSNKGLITDSALTNGFNTYMIGQPTSQVQIAADQNYGTCCNAENSYASKTDLCDKFLELLPECSSDNFVASGAGGALGDPHLTTLDGLSFTFNGHGEFILLQASDVEVQGRFSPQRNAAGVKSATYISGVAGQQSSPSSDKIEFRLNSGKTDTEILKNGVLQSVDLSTGAIDWNEVSITKSVSSQNISTWKMIFSGGLTAGVQLNNQMFQLVVEASSSYRNNFKGLLGNFDGQTSNDFTSPNGTITPSSSVESDIYTYGVEWQNNASNTLFTYDGGDNNTAWSSHIDSSYTPVFFNADLTVMFTNASKRAAAISTCNNGESTDSDPEKRRECYFDFKVTENAALASSTSDTKTALVETQSTLANYPPEIKNGNVTIEVTVGGNFTLQLIAEDQNAGDTISFFLNSDAPSGLSVDNTTKILTWSEVPDSNSMSIQITASDGKAQSLWTPKIKLCKCQNGATCGFNVDSSDQFYIVPCTCVNGYDGDFCQNDMDGCAASPCFPGVACSDVLARDLTTTPAGFQCGSCPTHLVGNGISCSDKDECVVNKPPPCSQNCTNIANGYTCSCVTGYILGSDSSTCQDIDECLIKTDRCDAATTVCNNTVGSYTCDCKTGFTTDTTYACTDINECSTNPCPANSRCQNTVGSYICACNFGYEKNTQTNTCEDKDECAGSNNCQQKCVDGVGTYTCSCNTGYRLNETDLVSCLPENECTAIQKATCDGGSGRASCAVSNGDVLCSCPSGYALNGTNYCIDIDECSTGADNCVKTKSDCVNLQGGFKCQCKSGYKALSALVCTDFDECASSSNNSCTSPATCTNNEGGYTCVCPSGYVSSGQYSCSDINECASAATHACDKEYGECSNTPGGYTCTCNKGFTGNGYVCADLNECASSSTNNCTQTCSNSIGSYTCSCLNGYLLDADKITCNDVNECNDTSANGCYSNRYCTNTVGSYTCSCPSDYRLKGDGKTCESIYQCAANHGCSHTCGKINNVDTCSCPTGMELDNTNKTCVDTNECASQSTNLCRLVNNVVCLDTNGSYVCNCVNSSYVKTQATVCVDADECVLGTANCPANSRCVNQNPGYECQCLTGYSKFGATCQDINECNQANDCNDTLGICTNTAGGYTCACKSGYTGDGRTCIDVDECSLNTHNCDSRVARRTCTNTPGSFTCGCISGYQLAGDQRTCNDVDECTGNHGCSQLCQNKDGGYDCACQTGYRLEADQRTCVVESECAPAKKATCQNQMCAKVNGTDTCQCPPGYQLAGDGTTCNDVDECQTNPCYATNSNCTNRAGGYNCSCTNGYILGPNNVCKDRNGGLSNWSAWSNCTKQCGTGSQTRTRSCNNPTRQGSGADCSGALSQTQDCNTNLCPPNEVEKNYGIVLQFKGLPVSSFTTTVRGQFRTTVATGITNFCNKDNANLRQCCSSQSSYVPSTASPLAYTTADKIAIGDGYPRDVSGTTQIMLIVKSDRNNALCSASKRRRKRGVSLGGSEIAIPQAVLASIMSDPTISQAVVSNIIQTVQAETGVVLNITTEPIKLVTNTTNDLIPIIFITPVQVAASTPGVSVKEGVTEGWVVALAVIFSLIGILILLFIVFVILVRANIIFKFPEDGKKSKEEDTESEEEKSGDSEGEDKTSEESPDKKEEKSEDTEDEKEEEKSEDIEDEKEEKSKEAEDEKEEEKSEGTAEEKEEEKSEGTAEEKEEEKSEEHDDKKEEKSDESDNEKEEEKSAEEKEEEESAGEKESG
ncbi:serine-rich adhesin for platelets-like [Saccostrea echinata]|uniref:serine-rich adhesin for platelets-like n=1 Tax=Saccostrea echinata TaxID=191078 RepID=UPI002A83D176|nr:serine-rich adhesin for platelets-like [Saccostrea echinata]